MRIVIEQKNKYAYRLLIKQGPAILATGRTQMTPDKCIKDAQKIASALRDGEVKLTNGKATVPDVNQWGD